MGWQKRIRAEFGTEEHERKSCLSKRVFHDAFLAMQACKSIERNNRGLYIRIYECLYCDGLHLSKCGRGRAIYIARCTLRNNLKLMSQPDWWIKCPPEIREERVDDEIFFTREMIRLQAW